MTVKAFGLEKYFPITFQKCKIDPVQVVHSNVGLELIKIEDLKVDLNDGVFVEHSAVALFEHEIASCPLIGREGTPSHTHTHALFTLSDFKTCDKCFGQFRQNFKFSIHVGSKLI